MSFGKPAIQGNMHRCLRIVELLDEIFMYLDPTRNPELIEGFDPDIPPSKILRAGHPIFKENSAQPEFRHLFSAARTSKAFYGRSIHFMWRSTTLGDLLACLPADLFTVDKALLLREFRKDDWNRSSIYAARVKYLFSGSDEWSKSLKDILPHVILSLPPNIFPVLKGLTWDHTGNRFPYIGRLLNPAITSVSFRSSSEALSFLPTLPSMCPQLKHFTISLSRDIHNWDTPEELDAISSFLCQLSDIESICVPQLNETAMAHISRLPNLASLAFDVYPEDWSAPGVHELGFPSLEHMMLSYSPVEESIEFFEWFNQVPLTRVSATFSDTPDRSQIDDLFSAFSAGIKNPSLSEIWIALEETELEWFDDCRAENRSFRLLFCFVNLTHVMLRIPGKFELDDLTVLELSHAWPLIQKLELIEGTRFLGTPVTLSCLTSFAANCPCLNILRMSFDTSVIPCVTNTEAHRLKSLHVCHSPMTDPAIRPVTRFLSAFFPTLQRLKHKGDSKIRSPFDRDETDDEEERMERVKESKRCWKEVEVIVCGNGLSKS
ncbi:hypothetical protein K438DRAFT_1990921 [Mycena galopus ATCC 62051]|nr:hypothetical protein K438DRAFT_1990921 [Mycena galopus ATCC 62051]